MDTLKRQLDRIQQQLAGLSASQKMLTASLAAIMIMTFLWWGRYAGTSEMEPVFNQSLSADDMNNVKRVLTAEGIRFEPSGGQILVPAEKRDYALAALAQAQVLPRDGSGNFMEMFSQVNIFETPQTKDKMFNEFLQTRIAEIIGHMKGVAEANVLIDPTYTRQVSGTIEPSASVSVRMKPGAMGDKKLAQAIAEFVAGTNAKMKRSRVKVLIDGHPYTIKDPDPMMPDGEIDEKIAKAESYFAEQVKTALSAYGNVVAVVHAKIDLVSSRKQLTTTPKVQKVEKEAEEDTTLSSSPPPLGVGPGTEANTGLEVTAPVSVNASNETSKTRTVNEIFADRTVEDTTKPSGEPKAISVAISIPRTLFVQELKAFSDGSARQPSPKEVNDLFATYRDDIIRTVQNAIGIEDPNQVSIVLGPDVPMLMAVEGIAGDSKSSGGLTGSLTNHAKEIAIGVLAIVSLFMVVSMVKKGTPAPVIEAAVIAPEPIALGGALDIAGEVSEGGQTLDGMEIDDDAIRAQQMVSQVSTMVKENPEAAANLVKRWLNRS